MRSLINVITMSVLLTTGIVPASTGRADNLPPFRPVDNILKAHNFFQGPNGLSGWIADAKKWTAYYSDSTGKLQGYFERRVSVARAGGAFKRYKVDPLGIRQQVDLFDGTSQSRFVIENGKLTEDGRQVEGSQNKLVEFSVNTFGLIPILQQLADPLTQVTYSGHTTQGQNILKVITASDSWTMYVDQDNLIYRVEMKDKAIEYKDYRLVEGVWLPLTQRMFVKGRLFYEMFFTRIELSPKFPSFYFSSEALKTDEPSNRRIQDAKC